MYPQYHHRRQASSMTTIVPEKHLFLQVEGIPEAESGLVLSTDAKPILKWTPELHDRCIDAVNQLGGVNKATSKTVMRLMGIPGLTLYHLKSHLQKYRLSKGLPAQANSGSIKNGGTQTPEQTDEGNGTFVASIDFAPQKTSKVLAALLSEMLKISETLQMQIEVQRYLHKQLEVQRHLQLRIEAQGKYLQSVLEKAQETLGKQNLGSPGLEAAKVQLSELVTKVSNECFTNVFLGLEERSSLHNLHIHPNQHDCTLDSCLTSSEVLQREQDINDVTMNLRTYHNPSMNTQKVGESIRLGQNQPVWLMETERTSLQMEKNVSILPVNIKVQGESRILHEVRRRERDYQDHAFLEETSRMISAGQQDRGKKVNYGLSCHATQLDLNTNQDNEGASKCKLFDLNDFN